MRLREKVILITAAGQGLGEGIALACAAEGARVVATDIDPVALDRLAGVSPDIEVHVLDVRDSAAVSALAARLQPVDGLVNCAGYVHEGSILECKDADWDLSFDINIKGAYRVTRAFLPGMLGKSPQAGCEGGSIVNIASMASSVKGFPRRLAYGSTKAAMIGFTKALAADFVGEGLRCNAVCPGTIDTPSLRARIAAAPDPVQARKDYVARQPMKRLAEVDDITPQVVYLLSDESRFVTGQAILVDGGVTI